MLPSPPVLCEAKCLMLGWPYQCGPQKQLIGNIRKSRNYLPSSESEREGRHKSGEGERRGIKNLADIDRKAVKVGYSPCQQCACSHLSAKRENHAHARHVVQSLQLEADACRPR